MLISVEDAWQAYPRGLPTTGRVMLAHIMSAVVLHTGISADDIKSKRRTIHLVFARQVYCYLARTMTPNSYPQIAMSIMRDHTTVMHAVDAVADKLKKGEQKYEVAVAICRSTAIHFAGGHE